MHNKPMGVTIIRKAINRFIHEQWSSLCATIRQIRIDIFLLCVVLAGTIVCFFVPTIINLVSDWDKPEYSHGLFIFLTALFWGSYLYANKKPPIIPSYCGFIPIVLALLMNIFGNIAANNWINQYSLVVLIAGLIQTLAGTAVFRTLLPATFLLSFMIPLPPLLLANMTVEMQLLSSTASVAGLNLLNIPVYQEGNIIDLGNYKLQVAEACSGLRYLFPFLSFGYLFALLFENSWWKRGVMIAMIPPITIAMNTLRIIFVGITVDAWGLQMAEGALHEFEGFVVFIGCIGFLVLTHWVLSLIHTVPVIKSKVDNGIPRISPPTSQIRQFLIGLIGTILLGLMSQHMVAPASKEAPIERQSFNSFPLGIGLWRGTPQELPPDQIEALKFSDYFLADYQDSNSYPPINLYMAYYASQRRNAAPHSPLVCISGSGWEIVNLNPNYLVKNERGAVILHVNRALIKSGDKTELVYYWFQERGRDLTTSTQRKWYLFIDSLTKRRTDGALIRVATPIIAGEDVARTDHRISSFLNEVKLTTYIPD